MTKPLSDTASLLLHTAERLFAQSGIENVSLRQIVAAAGQRNGSALHYHFGSREAMVSALLNLRLHHIDAVRLGELDALQAATPNPSPRALLAASIRALAHVVQDEPWGSAYVQVLEQTTFTPRLMGDGVIALEQLEGLRRVRRLMREALPALPGLLLNERMVMINDTVVHGIAHWARLRERSNTHTASAGLPAVVARLADFCAAGLQAPASPAALEDSRLGITPALRTRTPA